MQAAPQVDPPRGIFATKVDDKGRLKLPGNFQEYMTAIDGGKTYITTFDKATCKIYTIPAWNANLKLLETAPDKAWAKAMKFRADEWGQDSEMDGQGRFLLPTNLRRLLNMESGQVWLRATEGVIEVLPEAAYQALKSASDEIIDSRPDYGLELGLK